MKFLLITLACIIAGIAAEQVEQENRQERIEVGIIIDAIDGISQDIKDLGLDPLIIRREAAEYALPVPVLFNAAGWVEDVLSFGLSDIRVHRMNYSILLFRLTFDIEMPHIHLSIGDSYGEVTIFGETFEGQVSGSVDVNSIRVTGVAQVSVSIISGISVSRLTINFTLRSIESNLNVNLLGLDISEPVNTFLGQTITDTLLEFRADIDRLLEIVLLDIINANL